MGRRKKRTAIVRKAVKFCILRERGCKNYIMDGNRFLCEYHFVHANVAIDEPFGDGLLSFRDLMEGDPNEPETIELY